MKLMDGIANKWTTKELRQGGVLEWLIRDRMSVILTGPPGIMSCIGKWLLSAVSGYGNCTAKYLQVLIGQSPAISR